jgi:hypothetical protein
MGFLAISDQSGPALQNRKETVRFPAWFKAGLHAPAV